MTVLILASLVSFSARAQDVPAVADDDDAALFSDKPTSAGANAGVPDTKAFEDEDDIDIAQSAPVKVDEEKNLDAFADPKLSMGGPSNMPVNVSGATPLADNWAPKIVIVDQDAVVVEMPVFYGRSRSEFGGVAYWLVAEVYADGKKVGESRAQVTRDALADKGPSVQFFRIFAPVPAKAGVLEIKVGKAASGAAKPDLLFTRSVQYKLG